MAQTARLTRKGSSFKGSPSLAAFGSLRGTTADSETYEDEEMERNPGDYPFPSFNPTKEEIQKQRREAQDQMMSLRTTNKTKPVIDFKHPDMSFMKPLWRYDKSVERTYVSKLDMLSVKDECLKHPVTHRGLDLLEERHRRQATALPQWVSTIRRVAEGCPQLGLPVQYEAPGAKSRRAEHRLLDQQRHVAEEEKKHRKKSRKSSSITQQRRATEVRLHARGIGKPKTRKEEYDELLSSQEFLEVIRSQCVTPPNEGEDEKDSYLASVRQAAKRGKSPLIKRKSVLISLPKIGVRMYDVVTKGGVPLSQYHEGAMVPHPPTTKGGKGKKKSKKATGSSGGVMNGDECGRSSRRQEPQTARF